MTPIKKKSSFISGAIFFGVIKFPVLFFWCYKISGATFFGVKIFRCYFFWCQKFPGLFFFGVKNFQGYFFSVFGAVNTENFRCSVLTANFFSGVRCCQHRKISGVRCGVYIPPYTPKGIYTPHRTPKVFRCQLHRTPKKITLNIINTNTKH